MFSKILGIFILLGLISFTGFTYYRYLNSMYEQKEAELMQQLEMLQRRKTVNKNQETRLKNQLKDEYQTLKNQLELQYKRKIKSLENQYGNLKNLKRKASEKTKAEYQEMLQREQGLKKLQRDIKMKEMMIQKQQKDIDKKMQNINKLNLECQIFDLRSIDEYIKEFNKVAYATKEKVNLFCGFDPDNKTLVNPKVCLRAKKDREKAKSLLNLIHNLSKNVESQMVYRRFIDNQRYRMEIDSRLLP